MLLFRLLLLFLGRARLKLLLLHTLPPLGECAAAAVQAVPVRDQCGAPNVQNAADERVRAVRVRGDCVRKERVVGERGVERFGERGDADGRGSRGGEGG